MLGCKILKNKFLLHPYHMVSQFLQFLLFTMSDVLDAFQTYMYMYEAWL